MLASAAATERLAIVAGHVARSGLDNPASLLTSLKKQPEVTIAILTGLARGWPRDSEPATPEWIVLGELFEKLPAAGKSQLVTLATRWGSQGLGQHIAKLTEFLSRRRRKTRPRRLALQPPMSMPISCATTPRREAADLLTPQTSPDLARPGRSAGGLRNH